MFKFLNGLDNDLRQTVLKQIRDLWTHTSTAIEGNALSLGDTKFILEEGLTVSGKPIKDHNEVVGHAKAIDLLYNMLGRDMTEADLFNLHKAVQTAQVVDIYKPYGAWKIEPNGAYALDKAGKRAFVEFADPIDVPGLMKSWLSALNQIDVNNINLSNAPLAFAKLHVGFTQVHPFWDGNGRIARLISNIPLLKAGLPPLIIHSDDRKEYIELLSSYSLEVGQLTHSTGVWPITESITSFEKFCCSSYSEVQMLIDEAFAHQKKRNTKI